MPRTQELTRKTETGDARARRPRGEPREFGRCLILSALCLNLALPTGAANAGESPFQQADDAIVHFMKDHEVHAATFAVSRDGRLLHERAFGFADRELTQPLTPKVRMRIASISKPLTAAAIQYLVRKEALKLSDPVVKYLPEGRFPKPADKRWNSITLGEVLEHKGGWDRAVAGDPMFQDDLILKDLKTNSLAPADVVCWMMTRSLQFNPGARSAYSNFGFCLLGVIIEQVTGESYAGFMQHTVFREAGMTTMTLSSSRPEQRNRDEIWYDFGDEGEHFNIEPMQAHGGWVCTAADLTRFLDKFWINGAPRLEGHGSWVFYGSLPGTTSVAVQRPDGLNYVLLVNKRGDGAQWNEKLKTLLDDALR